MVLLQIGHRAAAKLKAHERRRNRGEYSRLSSIAFKDASGVFQDTLPPPEPGR